MKTYKAAEDAIELAIYHFEVNRIAVNTDTIRHRVYSWYNNTDITDCEILAACAIEGIDWHPNVTYQMMINIKDYWFPQDPYENYFIGDIEMAQYDIYGNDIYYM